MPVSEPAHGDQRIYGIVGCGHLGQALALAMIRCGVSKSRMLLSHRGRRSTQAALDKADLLDLVVSNQVVLKKADVVFLCVRPDDVNSVVEMEGRNDLVIASCIAGLSLSAHQKMFKNAYVVRLMPSSPHSILAKQGVCALYPYDDRLAELLSRIGFSVFALDREEELATFTAAVCLPTVFLEIAVSQSEKTSLIEFLGADCSCFPAVYRWAESAVPKLYSEDERRDYIQKAATEGGITDAILKALNTGDTFIDAMKQGVARSLEISKRVSSA